MNIVRSTTDNLSTTVKVCSLGESALEPCEFTKPYSGYFSQGVNFHIIHG